MFENLGSTPDTVAASLRKLGITGVRNAVGHLNLLVRFAQLFLRDRSNLDVMSGTALRVRHADGRQEEVPLPEAVIGFLDAFNRGAFPELEMRE
jgi:hypothetical protein